MDSNEWRAKASRSIAFSTGKSSAAALARYARALATARATALTTAHLAARANLLWQGKSRKEKEFTFYFILWKGFPPEVATWEPEASIHDDFVDAYEAALEAEAELDAEEAAEDAEDDMDVQ